MNRLIIEGVNDWVGLDTASQSPTQFTCVALVSSKGHRSDWQWTGRPKKGEVEIEFKNFMTGGSGQDQRHPMWLPGHSDEPEAGEDRRHRALPEDDKTH